VESIGAGFRLASLASVQRHHGQVRSTLNSDRSDPAELTRWAKSRRHLNGPGWRSIKAAPNSNWDSTAP